MLKKCLKYDMGAIYKLWCIAAAAFLSMSVPVGLAIRFMILNGTESVVFMILGLVAEFVAYIAVIAFSLMTVIAICVRYYKSFFSDEGYLTFTLPVKRSTLFYSKVLNAVIWQTATIVVIAIAVIIVAVILPPAESSDIGGAFVLIMEDLPPLPMNGWTVLAVVEIVVFAMLSLLAETLLIYFCITMGSIIAKKQKVILSVGIWYIVNQIVLPIAGVVLVILAMLTVTSGMGAFPTIREGVGGALISLTLFIADLASVAICTVLTFINIDLIERKLNLA